MPDHDEPQRSNRETFAPHGRSPTREQWDQDRTRNRSTTGRNVAGPGPRPAARPGRDHERLRRWTQLTHVCQTAARRPSAAAGADKESRRRGTVPRPMAEGDLRTEPSGRRRPAVFLKPVRAVTTVGTGWSKVHQGLSRAGTLLRGSWARTPEGASAVRPVISRVRAGRSASPTSGTRRRSTRATTRRPLEHFEPLVREMFSVPPPRA